MPNDPDITSMPNYLQTLMLETLAVIRNVPITQIPDLQQEKIYDINYSPNIQWVKAANNNTLSSATESEWRWCDSSKGYNELIVPALGYYFGGSRYDVNYKDKQFKQEDCSSALGKWLGLPVESITTFSTRSFISLDNELKSILKPIGEDRDPKTGDVFWYQGHCGVVTCYEDKESAISVLSCNRFMPFFEGFVYQKYSPIENGKKVVVLDPEFLAEEDKLTPYYGLDNNLSVEQKIVGIEYFDEVWF